MIIYSQSDEQEHILGYFGEFKGRFLDIGAYNGKTFSNTYSLMEKGWSGVCIEPSPYAFRELIQIYHTNSSITCVNTAIAKEQRLVEFYDSNGDAVSTTSGKHAKKWGSVIGFKKFWINTCTIDDILSAFGDQFEMISLDVEGTNIEILKTIPLDRMNTRLICVEFDGDIETVKEYCKGFHEIHRTNENIIMAK